ncbi:MAG: elongation factor G, partial [Lachnospiraceae bacterium]
DDDKASYRELILKLESRFGKKVAPLQLPIRENEEFVGFVNIVKMKGRRFKENSAEYVDAEIPDYSEHNLKIAREALMEAVAESSEEFMERYFSGDSFTEQEVASALREQVATGDMVPVMMGSGICGQGTNALMNAIVRSL